MSLSFSGDQHTQICNGALHHIVMNKSEFDIIDAFLKTTESNNINGVLPSAEGMTLQYVFF